MGNMFRCTLATGGGAFVLTVTCDADFAGLTITATDGTTTLTQTCPSTSPYTVEFKIPNGGTWTISSGTSATSVVIPSSAELHDIPNGSTITPTDDIQIWLHCANIWDKSYTTISQVLADASTLQALIASNNAADYMARSTTWAASVTSNQSAMSYIGLNDYCSEALLSNLDWSTAICNSNYMTSVLDAKVPTMTSNTTPYGTAFAYLNTSTDALGPYTSFDGKTTSTAASYGASMPAGHNSSYVGYVWREATAVKKVTFHLIRHQRINARVKIQGSNDGDTWSDLSDLKSITLTADNVITGSIITSSFAKYNRVRLYIEADSALHVSGQTSCHFVEVQFYGRT